MISSHKLILTLVLKSIIKDHTSLTDLSKSGIALITLLSATPSNKPFIMSKETISISNGFLDHLEFKLNNTFLIHNKLSLDLNYHPVPYLDHY
jgi:hypothetical protein